MNILYYIIIAAAIWGLKITIGICKKKRSKGPMVCPLGADCHSVITSDFSRFLGIGLEFFGMAYYSLMIIAYSLLIFIPSLFNDWIIFILTIITISAFLFSIYLTVIQAFFIKSWCSWCLFSAGISTVIFIATIISVLDSGISFIPILNELSSLILIMHLLGFAFGIGGVTISDILFFKFLKDFRITKEEDKILKIMSQIVWLGLLIIVISDIGIYLQNPEALIISSKFLLKVITIVIIIINGAILNLIISPKLLQLNFNYNDVDKPTILNVRKTNRLRKIVFASGAISFVSWYTAIALGILTISVSFYNLLSIYLGVLVFGVFISQVIEKLYSPRSKQN